MFTKHNIDEPSLFGTGIISLFTLRKFPESFDFTLALQAYKDHQVDALFEDPLPLPVQKKLKVETVAEHVKSVDSQIANALRRSASNGLKRSHEDAEHVAQTWFENWYAHGKAGNVGLVPGPARMDFPTSAEGELDQELKEYLVHFYEYLQTRQGLQH